MCLSKCRWKAGRIVGPCLVKLGLGGPRLSPLQVAPARLCPSRSVFNLLLRSISKCVWYTGRALPDRCPLPYCSDASLHAGRSPCCLSLKRFLTSGVITHRKLSFWSHLYQQVKSSMMWMEWIHCQAECSQVGPIQIAHSCEASQQTFLQYVTHHDTLR